MLDNICYCQMCASLKGFKFKTVLVSHVIILFKQVNKVWVGAGWYHISIIAILIFVHIAQLYSLSQRKVKQKWWCGKVGKMTVLIDSQHHSDHIAQELQLVIYYLLWWHHIAESALCGKSYWKMFTSICSELRLTDLRGC